MLSNQGKDLFQMNFVLETKIFEPGHRDSIHLIYIKMCYKKIGKIHFDIIFHIIKTTTDEVPDLRSPHLELFNFF